MKGFKVVLHVWETGESPLKDDTKADVVAGHDKDVYEPPPEAAAPLHQRNPTKDEKNHVKELEDAANKTFSRKVQKYNSPCHLG